MALTDKEKTKTIVNGKLPIGSTIRYKNDAAFKDTLLRHAAELWLKNATTDEIESLFQLSIYIPLDQIGEETHNPDMEYFEAYNFESRLFLQKYFHFKERDK